MDRYAVVGNPVQHSRSPFIHAAFARQTGQDLSYRRLLCPLDGFEGALRAFAADRSGGPARGCNVTVPFKVDAWRLATQRSARAELAQAANVLRFDADGWFADNTDGIALVHDIERNAGVPLAGRRVLMIGAGGAAAGALGPLLAARPHTLVVANRSFDKAAALVARHAPGAAGVDLVAAPTADCGGAFDVVVNATATSLQGLGAPVSATVFAPGALALDMMYGAAALSFIAWAERHGARGRDGLGMLVEQAAEAFLLWRGVMPATRPVLTALRAQIEAEAQP
jgi:shikimate dehydrogenase